MALQDLDPFNGTATLESQGGTSTNSSMLYPDEYQTSISQELDRNCDVNSTGM